MSLAKLSLLVAFSAASAQAGIIPPHPPGSHQATQNPPMLYWGGPVVEHAKIFAIFWGPSVDVETQTRVGGFLRAIGDSSYFDFLNDEYNTFFFDSNGHTGTFQSIDHAHYMGATTIFPANTGALIDDSVANHEITSEINRQIALGVLPANDANSIYLVFLPPNVVVTDELGKSGQDWCALNGATPQPNNSYMNYGVIADQGGPTAPCSAYLGAGVRFDATTISTSWVINSCVTNPEVPVPGTPQGATYPETWIAADGETEISSVCFGPYAHLASLYGSYSVVPMLSRSQGQCTTQDFTAK